MDEALVKGSIGMMGSDHQERKSLCVWVFFKELNMGGEAGHFIWKM